MPSSPIKVVFLTQDLWYGGTQRQTIELARRMDRTIFLPSIWTLTGATDLDKLAQSYNIDVHNLGKNPSPNLSFILYLIKKLIAEKPDILVPCTALPNIWGRILGKVTNVPVIIGTCRGASAPISQHERYLRRLVDHMVCNSIALNDIISSMGMPSKKITYIPNGVDIDFYETARIPLNKRQALILCVGRLVEIKDYPTLLNAFKIVLKTIPRAKLRIVGDGPQKHALQKIIAHPDFKNAVELVDASLDIRHHYQEAQVFALTSSNEGQPNVVLEAMASSLPIVCTAVGGLPNMVQDKVTGFLCPAGNAHAIANNICALLENSALCQKMGDAGRQRVIADFSFESMVQAHQNIFEKLWQIHKSN